jgi:hypothetical protein
VKEGRVDGPDPLRVRLFGYGVPYQVRFGAAGQVHPVATDAAREAVALARELAILAGFCGSGAGATVADRGEAEPGTWAVSMPFGRCGVGGLPREHLSVYNAEEARLEMLWQGAYHEIPVPEGRLVEIVPGRVVRLRARPRPGRRVVVAFQTQDRTPLLGNAGPFVLDGQVPEECAGRLVKAHGDYDRTRDLAARDPSGCQAVLDGFFAAMAARLEGRREVQLTQEEAGRAGSYAVVDEAALFARQRGLLTPQVVERIRSQDAALFRFPGMFGGITTLFNALT